MRANTNGPICCFCKYVIKLWGKRSDICIGDQRCKNRHHFRKHEIGEKNPKNTINTRNLKTELFEKIRFRKCNKIRRHLLETLNICIQFRSSTKKKLPFNRSKYRRHAVIYKKVVGSPTKTQHTTYLFTKTSEGSRMRCYTITSC